ncbi:zinc finger protein 271-like [Periplaneta americana]|uniref:zinc finger protein 271-like n=1 Tax=Periplaneta americana TaxID=6978 RepID=UPI0037E9C6A9
MSKVSDKEFDTQCRLCTSTEEGHIQIFGPEGECRNLASKIKECLPVSIEREDALPKSVCKNCIHKLEEYHTFRGACVQAELALESSLKDQQPSAFPLEPECCLQEVEPASSSVRPAHPVESQNISVNSRTSENVYNVGNSALNIFPRPNSPTMKKLMQRQGLGDLVITPVIPKTSNNLVAPTTSNKPSHHWSRVGHPTLEDYVLMKEDTFTVDSTYFDNNRTTSRLVASGQIEFHANHSTVSPTEQDKDILVAQRRKREVLPPMWDVYEKVALSPGKENSNQNGTGKMVYTVTHRRYIISKGAFPCSLCKRCFRINQGFEREGSESRDVYEGDENSVDLSNSKSSDYDEHTASTTNNSHLNMKFFSCHICCKVFPRRSSLKRHQRTHMDRKLFSCPLCQKGFNRKEHLSRHMISHSGGRPYNCDICYKPFTRKEHLSRHRLCHLNALRYSLGDSSSTLEVSIQNNSAEAPVTETSDNHSPSSNVPPVQDDDSSSNMSRPFVCDLCGQGFARKEHLLRHQLRTHRTTPEIRDELKPYNCNVCSKNFTRKEHLVRHQKIHMREFLFGSARGVIPGTDVSVSPVLTNRATSSGGTVMKTEPLEGLVAHPNLPGLSISTIPSKVDVDEMKMEPVEVEAMTNGQDDEISLQSSLQDGPSTSAEGDGSGEVISKPHRCQFCPDKTFTRRSHLVRHFKRFHSDKPLSLVLSYRRRASSQEKQEFERYMLNNGQYWCIICGKTFGRRYHLIRHMKLHGPNEIARPFHCSACNNSFSRHEYFQTHKCKSSNEELSTKPSDEGVPSAEVSEEPKEVVKKMPAKRDKRKRSKCNYECVTCGKGFSKKKLLNRHSESHVDLNEDNSQHLYD